MSAAASADPSHRPRYAARMEELSRKHGVPVSLIHRIIMRESKYAPGAVNRGHYGMMQIKLATAKGMGYQGGASGLLDGNTNMTYAVPYLANAYIAAGHNEDRAVQLYAGGYYYVAKRKGVLGRMRTANSAPLSAVAEQKSSASQPFFSGLFSETGGAGTRAEPATAFAETGSPQIALASASTPAEAAPTEKKLTARELRAARREQARADAQARKEEAERKKTEAKLARAEKETAAKAPVAPQTAPASEPAPSGQAETTQPEKKLTARELRAARREQARADAQARREEAERKKAEAKLARAEKATRSSTSESPAQPTPDKSVAEAPAADTPVSGASSAASAPAPKNVRANQAAKIDQARAGGKSDSDEAIKKFLTPRQN